jgi:hypothetical protein
MKGLKTKDFNFCPFCKHEAKVKPFLFKRSFSIFKSNGLHKLPKETKFSIFLVTERNKLLLPTFERFQCNAICL